MLKKIQRALFMLFVFYSFCGITTSFSQITDALPKAITEVYGTAAQTFSKEQIDWLKTELKRAEVLKMISSKEDKMLLLSNQGLMTKFIPDLKKDDFSKPLLINPLKYNIDFLVPEDQFFRIDGTDYVLFIAGRK